MFKKVYFDLICNLICNSYFIRGQGCKLSYHINDNTMISNSDTVSCAYVLLCEGPHLVGVHNINMRGMLQCRFNQLNKLISMEIIFDVMGFMQQFQVCLSFINLLYFPSFLSFLLVFLFSCFLVFL